MKIYKVILLNLIACLAPTLTLSQYGNDWFDVTKQYYKFQVAEDGIYRIEFADLKKVGMAVESISGVEYRLFGFGKEIRLHVTSDYLEFYAEKNDGRLDKVLYENQSDIAHTEYSLYTDTAIYFLTHTPGQSGLRYTQDNSTDISGLNEIKFYLKENIEIYPEDFHQGARQNKFVTHPKMNDGEGYFSFPINRNSQSYKQATFDVRDYYNVPNIEPRIETMVFTELQKPSYFTLPDGTIYDTRPKLEYENDGKWIEFLDDHLRGFETKRYNKTVPKEIFTKPTVSFKINVDGYSYDGERLTGQIAVSHFKVIYPASFDMFNKPIYQFDFTNTNNDRYFLITNFQNESHVAYDLENGIKLNIKKINNDLQTIIPTSLKEHQIVISTLSNIKTLLPQPYSFNKIVIPSDIDYIIISSDKLKKSATHYFNYRLSEPGGSHKAMLVFVEDLYNQYYYGFHHPQAIKNFLANVVNNYSVPKNVFLIGKGLALPHLRSSNSGTSFSDDLIPTIGYPTSDIYYGSNLINGEYLSPFGIGRLAVKTNEEVEVYLQKVKVYENLEPAIWRKNFLHVGGGENESEIIRLANYLSSYQEIAESPQLGAKVHFIGKSSKSVIQDIDQSIIDRINNGVSFFSYFGHAASNVLEINIGNPTTYNNAQRPMVMFLSGCVIGNCFEPEVFLGESYIFAKNGAVNWIAPSTLSLENEVNAYGYEFYKQMSNESYGLSIGEIINNTMHEYTKIGVESSETQSLLYITQGDPANKIYSPPLPDYYLQPSDIYITPEGVTAQDDEFIINIIARNIGRATNDSVACKITVHYPDNSAAFDTILDFGKINNTESFQLVLDNSKKKQFGIFKIVVELDPKNKIPELSENNNSNTHSFNLISNGAAPLFPISYGIVSEKTTELTAQSLDPTRQSAVYFFEIDTVPTFLSPWKKRSGALKRGQVANWVVQLLPNDTQAYYWRVRIELAEGGLSPWRSTSFSHINNSASGWSQVEFRQMQNSKFDQMVSDTAGRLTKFSTTFPKLYFLNQHGKAFGSWANQPYTFGKLPPTNDAKGIRAPLPGTTATKEISNDRTENGMIVYALDPFELNPFMPNIGVGHSSISMDNGEYRFDWMTSENEYDPNVIDSFLKFLKMVPNGYHLFAYTGYYHLLAKLKDERIYSALEKFGSQGIRGVQNDGIWAMIGQKGIGIGKAEEAYTTDQTARIFVTKSLGTSQSNGSQTSIIIGPARKWRSVEAQLKNNDKDKNHDEYQLNVYGYGLDNKKTLLAEGLDGTKTDISFINSTSYPFLELELLVKDEVKFTPLQLKNWTVIFDQLPDGMLNSEIEYQFSGDTLGRGEELKFSIAYLNTSIISLPEVEMNYSIINSNREVEYTFNETIPALKPGEHYLLKKNFNSDDLSGTNRLVVKTNPDNKVLELYTFNNNFEKSFYVERDEELPILDVTFDGIRILNGDIISPTPTIKISGEDNDKFFLLNDPSYFDISLQMEGEATPTHIDVSDPAVTFYPAKDENNKAYFEYSPDRLQDGKYELSVQLTDGSGNKAGKIAFDVNFEVVGKSSITNFYPYPNPFSTEMRFVYTLTGETFPDEILVQIMTVSGKIVKEIDLNQFGSIKIGHNISEFTWNGTDEYGNRLANGVYLYRVKTTIDKKQIEHRTIQSTEEQDFESFFKDGFGKIYIIR